MPQVLLKPPLPEVIALNRRYGRILRRLIGLLRLRILLSRR
jgi:hypothetical protein